MPPRRRALAVVAPAPLETRRHFKQRRAALTYEALLDAAERVFAKDGYEGAQTPAIAAEAGVSTGAFYRYFKDKRQALLEMTGRKLQRAHDRVTARLDPTRLAAGDIRAVVAHSVDAVFELAIEDPRLDRVYVAMSFSDPEMGALRARFERMGLEVLTRVITDFIPRATIPDPRAAALVLMTSAIEVAQVRAGLRPAAAGRELSDTAVRHALVDMLTRYLGVDRA